MRRASLLLLLGCASFAFAHDEQLERWVRALDSAREPEWSEAFEQLSQLGGPAAARVLDDFERADYTARRARAKLLLQVRAPEDCPRVLALLGDPDPQVRRLLALWLGDPALAESFAEERVRELERLALGDPNEYVRGRAREALGECALPQAVAALDRLIELLPPGEAEKAATALAQLPLARERLLARVTAAFTGPHALADSVLAALLRGYGRALAEVPSGGVGVRERLPFLRGRTHPAPEVQAAARVALATFTARCAELVEPERADQVLARLGQEGWPLEECLRRRLDLAWLERGDPGAGLELARALERAAQTLAPPAADDWEVHALFYQGAAHFALAEASSAEVHGTELDAADALFANLVTRLAGARARRTDLFPSPRAEEQTPDIGAAPGNPLQLTELGGATQIDELHLLAVAHVWRALVGIARASEVGVLEELCTAHQLFLESRVLAARTGAPDPASLDALFERDVGPHGLVLFNDKLGAKRRAVALDQAVALAGAWASVAPLEMLGFSGAPAGERRLSDPFFDSARLEALRAIRAAEMRRLDRQLKLLEKEPSGRDEDRRDFQYRLWTQQKHELERADIEERRALKKVDPAQLTPEALRTVFARLAEALPPSMHAHALASELRSEGRAAEARAIAERALATLRTAPGGASSVWNEWASARFELLRGSTFMDEARAREAEDACLEAVRRLEAIETTAQEWRAAASDPEEAAQRDGQVRMIREMRGDALLSLAVNANVRLGDPARALEYFERAFLLNQNPFMRILRACYRARSGRVDEARVVLRSVVPVPSLYYNIACTHALLGEKESALDFLERDFRENYPTEGSLARQREWARRDPDLASLRGEPRFARLLGDAPGAAGSAGEKHDERRDEKPPLKPGERR